VLAHYLVAGRVCGANVGSHAKPPWRRGRRSRCAAGSQGPDHIRGSTGCIASDDGAICQWSNIDSCWLASEFFYPGRCPVLPNELPSIAGGFVSEHGQVAGLRRVYAGGVHLQTSWSGWLKRVMCSSCRHSRRYWPNSSMPRLP
jgi:hypothetical protein